MQTFGGDVVHPHDICYFLHFTNSEVVVYLKVVIHVVIHVPVFFSHYEDFPFAFDTILIQLEMTKIWPEYEAQAILPPPPQIVSSEPSR